MSNVVDFLQRAGESSQLRYASHADLRQALMQAGIASPLQMALLNADSAQLCELVGSRLEMCGVIYAPQDDAPDRQDPDDKEKYSA